MIPRTVPTWQSLRWQDELSDLIRDPKELFELLQLDPALLPDAIAASTDFPLRVPRSFAARMQPGDVNDPLLQQVLPLGQELLAAPGYNSDPLEESNANPHPGLIHKYRGRVLLIVSSNCAINCRYCFRRHFPYQDNKPGRQDWQSVLDYIAADASITEVIYSGGDPLAAADRQLSWMTEQVAAIPHIKRLRIHSRMPVVVPSRIDQQCLAWLSSHRLQTVMVLHANHANEINGEVAEAVTRLRNAGITLLNQTVLLRGINDSAAALAALSERLFEIGVLPYYLHLLDKVTGASHFDLDEARAKALHRELLSQLPGYLVPRLVREEPDAPSKLPVF